MPKFLASPWFGRIVWISVVTLLVVLVASDVAFASGDAHGGGGHGGGGLPQLNPKSFPSQLFWLAVTFGTLYLMLSNVALPRVGEVLETRDSRIAWDLTRAEELKNEASEVLAEVEQAVADARTSAQAAIQATFDEINAEAAARLAQLDSELAVRAKAAEVRIQVAKDDVIAELRTVGSELVQDISRQLTGNEIDMARATSVVGAILKEQR